MEYSAESVRFLYVAYALMALGQIAYVGFLAKRWNDAQKSTDPAEDRNA